MAEGLDSGIHTFIVLKGRQMGISTVCLALDLYWMFRYRGLQGSLVTDTDDNKTMFRTTLTQYIKGLPSTHRVGVKEHNRTQMVLANRSRWTYQVAGVRSKGGLGRGKAINFLHGTETSSWGDEEGFASLQASLAETHPHRLYFHESTARGYNLFYDTWEKAKEAKSQRAIFIGWWRNELYHLPPTSSLYSAYWDGSLTSDERIWVEEINDLYQHKITSGQIAWWRWKLAEEIKDETLMLQEYPPTENYAFQLSGSKFFSAESINLAWKRVRELPRRYFRYRMGMHFEQTRFLETNEENAELTVWELPKPGAVYVLGCDPAYGSSQWADRFCIAVYRCYADRIIQVAEFCTPHCNTYQFAWVIAHLAGNYTGAMVNLEINGPGQAVFNELQNLKRLAGNFAQGGERAEIYDVVGGIRDYLYRRQDSLTGHFAYQWQTTSNTKERMFNAIRDYFERKMLEIKSPDALLEFRTVVREDGMLGGDGRAKDDRCIATGLAVVAWNDWLMQELQSENRLYEFETQAENKDPAGTVLQRTVAKFFQQIEHDSEEMAAEGQ
jgi:hypothetical protein